MGDPSNQAKAIFLAAIEDHTPEQWPTFLERACGGDAKLRAEVEKLLRARSALGSFHEAPPAQPATIDEPIVERPGTIIGPYKLLEEIGEGGFGIVFMAEQIQPLRRKVALKVLKPGMDTRQVVARFEAERQALALMDHPNIARVFDGGETASGRPYFVMELVRGVPISEFCDRNQLSIRQRLELFLDVCQAMQHAHQKGVIHRDIKPSNVLVTLHDDKAVVKVIDFGIAKAIGQQLTEKTLFTGFAQMIGTPLYMSPEQAQMSGLDVDTRSDIYSLGVLLYELLTGTTPFDKERLRAVDYDEMRRIIREEEPPKPSTRISTLGQAAATVSGERRSDPKRLSQLLRGELDWIVMKALEKDRNRRYESASALAADVQRYLHHEPVLACPPSVSYRLRKFVRRNKGPVLAASVFLFLLLAGIAGTTIGLLREIAAERKAVGERDAKEEARRQAQRALNAMTDDVVEDLLGKQVQLTDKYREFLKKVLEYHSAFAAVKGDDPDSRHSRADGYFRVGRIRFFLGELHEAEEPYREALALQTQLTEEFPDRTDFRHDLGQTHRYLGMLLNSLQRTKEAEAEYTEAVRMGKQLTAKSNEARFRNDLATWISNLAALLLLDTDRLAEGEKLLRDSLAISEQLLREFPDEAKYSHGVFADYSTLGMLLKDTNRRKEAEEFCLKAVALSRKLPAKFRDRPEFRQDLASIYVSLGVLLQTTRRPREALEAWQESVRLYKQLVREFPVRPEFRHGLAASENNLGMLLHKAQRVPEAEKVWGECLDLYKQLVEEVPSRPDYRYGLAVAYHNMGSVFHGTKRPKEAKEAWRKAVEVGRELVREHPDKDAYRHRLVLSHGHLALQLYETGQLVQAEEAWREILELTKGLTHDANMAIVYHNFTNELESVRAPPDRIITVYRESLRLDNANASTHYGLGNALKAANQPEWAIREYREAIRLHNDYPEAHVNLGNILADRNELDAAIAEYREALATKQKFPEVYKAHSGLGNVLMAKRRRKEAIAEYQTALRFNANFAQAHYGLGNAYFPHRLEEAITEYRAAIRLDKNHAQAHTNLGNSLAVKGDLDEAISEYRRAIGIDKDLFEAHLNLGTALRFKRQTDEAIAEYRKAIHLRINDASAHDKLGLAWLDKGRLPDARAEFRAALRLEKNHAAAQEHLRHAERLTRLHERLPAVLAGKDKPKDATECLGFAQLCQPPYRDHNAAAVRFFREAFALDPMLAENLQTEHRYNAACAAALAGCGKGRDAAELDAKERSRLRQQALAWLQADLKEWSGRLNEEPEKSALVAGILQHWLKDTDFAGVRGAQALAKLPEIERQAWQQLWKDITGMQKRAQRRIVPEKK